ncbi:MAG: energy-dependent translational throttle protein EttA [Deltaproteobacteria bacterium]|nr:energy-dependent translational throttle protein EttA [Deltaproteobacteria bacterium]
MSEEILFSMHKVAKTVPPDKKIIKDISLSFFYGAKIGVLGLNGAGKSTLLRIIAGKDKDFIGDRNVDEKTTIGFLEQEPELDNSKTVKENVLDGLGDLSGLLKRFDEIGNEFANPDITPEAMEALIDEQAKVQEKIEAVNGWEIDHILEVAMDALRLPAGDQGVENLSGGERRRVALCRLLLSKPDILLLDEPTNHLDAESVQWLEQYLNEYPGTVIAVTHDRYFLDNTAGWILELDRGQGIPWKGNYSSWLDQKEKRLANEEKQESARRKTLQRELEWIKMAPRARHAKSKARISSYEQLLSENTPEKIAQMEIYIPPGPRLGDDVIRASGITKSYGDKLLFENLSFDIRPGSIVGIIGGNGAGKSTLFRLITGQEKPDAGEINLGQSVSLGYVDQMRDDLDSEKSVWEEISGGKEDVLLGSKEVNSRAYCSRFNFTGSDQQKKVGVLSGGERNRVHMAKLLKGSHNVLLLDEPSNDLDVNTLRALEEALLSFAGCALVISHDRWFLDRICTHIMAFEGDSEVVLVEGNFQDYEADKKKRLGDEALKPKRIKYRKLAA